MNLNLNLTVSVDDKASHSMGIDLSKIMKPKLRMVKLEDLISRVFIFPNFEVLDTSGDKEKADGPFRGKFVGGSVIAIGFNCFGNMRLVYARADAAKKVDDSVRALSGIGRLHPAFDQLGLFPSYVKTIDNSRTHISRFLSWN